MFVTDRSFLGNVLLNPKLLLDDNHLSGSLHMYKR